ncbi:MAG: flavodoxin domain-containing protein [Promethearchaeota archaeon]
MSGKVLVAYASRYGCTKEIAQKMGDILEEEDFECHVINLKEAKKKNWPYINVYDGVIVGSGIQISNWVPDAKKFLKEISEELNKGRVKYGIFVSAASAEVDCGKAKVNYIDTMVKNLNLPAPDLSKAFAGVLDFSKDSNVGAIKREALKFAAKEMEKEKNDLEFDYQGCNDLRDWPAIEQFARDFAILLK